MMSVIASPELLVIGTLLLLLLIVVTGGVALGYDIQRARLPAATEFAGLEDRLRLTRAEHADAKENLRIILKQIEERDRVASEVAALVEQLSALRLEYDGLSEARQQIDATKREATEAAGWLAEAKQLIETASAKTAEVVAERKDCERRVVELTAQIETLEHQRKDLIERLPDDLLSLQQRLTELGDQRGFLEAEIAELKTQRAAYKATREELEALTKRMGQIEATIKQLHEERLRLTADIASGSVELHGTQLKLAELGEERGRLEADIAELKAQRAGYQATREALDALTQRMGQIEATIGQLQEERSRLAADIDSGSVELHGKQQQVQDAKATLRDLETDTAKARSLLDAANSLRYEISSLEARKAAIEEDVDRLKRGTDEGPIVNALADLSKAPGCLSDNARALRAPVDGGEASALTAVSRYLEKLGLSYHYRTVAAFHTAIKINDISQMTILAGVSGTGKSLLPRRYAEAMGLHFLPIAVEPRWDSPQDLIGFYNYIEKQYRATELARSLVYMDPFNTSDLLVDPDSESFRDHVMLVLLDEMNLARVEYYFSEFLSRLELRPGRHEPSPDRRRLAALSVDIRGRNEGSVYLYPSHNVLFAGTMNDDESTQSLSDKVLDRSNVMQFSAPDRFIELPASPNIEPPSGYRAYREWEGWMTPVKSLNGARRGLADQVIAKLAGIMKSANRPFGHRLNEAMLAYVANYPILQGTSELAAPLADQVELRILPKLRGLTIDENAQIFVDLAKLVRDELHDHALAEALDKSVEMQRTGSGQFSWRGFARGGA